MRPKSFPIWLFWVIIFVINGEITLESVYQKVNDLEVEVKILKVIVFPSKSDNKTKCSIFRVKMPSSEPM